MQRTFTRQELYDLVWSTPIITLAGRFDISDRGLAKTCARYQIPVPGRGYWAKIEAGQSAPKTPLWKIDNPTLETVYIGGYKPPVNPYVAFAIEAAAGTVRKSKEMRQARAVPDQTRDVAEKEETPRAPREPIVFEPVRHPHSSVAGFVAALRSANPDQYGEVSLPGAKVHKSSVSRLTSFLHHLALALDQREIVLSHTEKGIKTAIGPDDVRLEIVEERRREKHIPTPAEQKRHDEHERRREIARRRGQWLSYESFWPEYDYIYSGKLSFEIHNWAEGARKRWKDGKHQSLESMLDPIADGILFHLAFEKARREEREAEERRRKHMAHRRELYKKRQERETNRLNFLRQLAEYQKEATDLRATIAKATEFLPQASSEYLRMIEWAQQRLAHIEAQNQIEVLTSNLQQQNLFPEPDDLYDPEGDPAPPKNPWSY
ncbi:hypothetical protein FJ930_23520 [Mesorhizobium sp. B2-4-15]|uniref:hypothetical protein n=1 Tax=Mesorhizobium sp. B2-4-15 TaxID=2589934 RepID=UPI001154DB5D|nr:hypothetical protein [Mesorhizobium sp. B2-4-15]TPK66915.1 hypothetical protein FJ930_23520 [Mesorhizobium sp. B2-4-15]